MKQKQILIEIFISLIFFPLGFYYWYLNNKCEIKSLALPTVLFISIAINVVAFNNIFVNPSGMHAINSLFWGNALTLIFLGTRIVVRKLSKIEWSIYYFGCLFALISLLYSISRFAFYVHGSITASIYIFAISFVLYIFAWLLITVKYPPNRRRIQ